MFKKDLLLFDLESTGLDVNTHELIQIAAILLDKKTLKPKKEFSSYIKPKRWAKRSPSAMAVNKIKWDQLKDAPSIGTVLKKFNKTFGKDVTPAMYGGSLDIVFLPAAYRSAGMKYPFEYHTFNLWPLCYTFMAMNKQLKNTKKFVGFTLENIGDYLKVPRVDNRHDAMGDCLYEADVFRAVIKAMKK